MSNRPSCEMLLYISGHGMDPGNICLIPNAIKPHPARKDLHIHKPNECYFVKSEEKYLSEFYQICNKAIGTSERGFVGGEVFIHQRGFIGVLGVIGLWCCYHCERRDDVFHHMVIVVDCCFAGRWGNTLELIIKCKDVALNEYCQLLRRFPMSIQCATNECEPSYGSLFTPLWCFMNTASAEELKYYRDLYRSQGSSVPDVQQHPFFISTSSYCPPLKCFNDADFFAYLSSKQVEELEEDLKDVRNGETLDVALTPEEQVDFKRFKHFSPLARPLVIAIAAVARELKNLRQSKVRQAEQFNTSSPQLQELPQAAKQCQQHIDQSLEALKYHMLRLLMCHRNHYVLDEQGNLNESNHATLRKMLESRHTDRKVPPGVYVFQGGQGDMSLIVTPGQEEVILIDGTKTAECFKAAWNSILRYLRRITKIVVTHHDEDHTYGIQLLLARYIVGENSDRLPDLDNAIIYMNTRNDIINTARNFKHEKEIQTLAEHLGLEVQPLIVENGSCRELVTRQNFFLGAILPKQSHVDEFRGAFLQSIRTRQVPSRGGTTAANVLSVNLVAVWQRRDAYLFTGDAHLRDVTEAAKDFLHRYNFRCFKYVDVPHHGSKHSNVTGVCIEHRGLARIPAKNYLISHCGNHHNPSFETVKDMLQSPTCRKLHFLYPQRNGHLKKGCDQHGPCAHWYCPHCITEQEENKIDTELHENGLFKFFSFHYLFTSSHFCLI